MKFAIHHKAEGSAARSGLLETAHGKIPTPVFMPVGTAGTVKGVLQADLIREVQAKIILGNTYHLYLRPGTEVLSKAGGLHSFMNWDLPLLTDSGGYQVFSLAEIRKLKEDGVEFQSHIDGSRHLFTPENVVDHQRVIGSDIMMALDECTPYPAPREEARKSMELTHRWLKRGLEHFRRSRPCYGFEQSFFPIIQGSVYPELRRQSAEVIAGAEMDGNAIGGLSVGEPAEVMYEVLETVHPILPYEKPRYLMGVGTPVNILEAIDRGVDMFDCVMPTRNGRNGMLFTREGIINIRNRKWMDDFSPIEAEGISTVSRQYSRAYLRHLIISGEMLGAQIASIHNLAFYLWLTREAREHIAAGDFAGWKGKMTAILGNRL